LCHFIRALARLRHGGRSPFTATRWLTKPRRIGAFGQVERCAAPAPHTHVALDDALEQGYLFCNMLAENRRATS
jgi:hypothetical protein